MFDVIQIKQPLQRNAFLFRRCYIVLMTTQLRIGIAVICIRQEQRRNRIRNIGKESMKYSVKRSKTMEWTNVGCSVKIGLRLSGLIESFANGRNYH